jgi:hypothetical protein
MIWSSRGTLILTSWMMLMSSDPDIMDDADPDIMDDADEL